MKKFTRTIEDFVCENCKLENKGNGYTNHCSNCLWSKHVDINPGDRASICFGLMEPVEFDQKRGILHRCKNCHLKRYNKVQKQDNYHQIILLTV